jgi:hypothetical protein
LGAERRRRWSYDEKVRLVEETLASWRDHPISAPLMIVACPACGGEQSHQLQDR